MNINTMISQSKFKSIIFLSLIFSIFQANSQEYIPFPLENAQWDMISEHQEYDPEYFSYIIKRDTIIDQKEYTIIGVENEKYADVAIRNDIPNHKVYAVYLNQLSSYMGYNNICEDEYGGFLDEDSTEYLLYDFDLQLNEPVEIFMPCGLRNQNWPRFYTFVYNYNQDIYLADNETRNGMVLFCSELIFGLTWVQGIGALEGPVYTHTNSHFEHNYGVVCFLLNSEPLFGICVSSNEQLPEIKNKVKYLQDCILIEVLSERNQKFHIELFDITGKLIKAFFTKENIIKIGHLNLKNGIYIVKISSENHTPLTYKFIK
jgi:hypothetical protein